ncbi:hypothetical protein KQH61_05395 [bacterium]|nr:hypothetical protein [bacterium]MCB2179336.1 hypothetical protein [bacterium]
MKRRRQQLTRIEHRFVEFVPGVLEEGILYISIQYATAIHLCACGCGNKVVTPITPTDWTLSYNGEAVSLYPSIGNWGFDCQSHYWIRGNKVVWARKWNRIEIIENRELERIEKDLYFNEGRNNEKVLEGKSQNKNKGAVSNLFQKILNLFKKQPSNYKG